MLGRGNRRGRLQRKEQAGEQPLAILEKDEDVEEQRRRDAGWPLCLVLLDAQVGALTNRVLDEVAVEVRPVLEEGEQRRGLADASKQQQHAEDLDAHMQGDHPLGLDE